MATNDDPTERQLQLEDLLPNQGYQRRVKVQRAGFRQQFGFFHSTAMESAMLYRAELLLGIYTLIAGIHYVFPNVPSAVIPWIVYPLAFVFSNVRLRSAAGDAGVLMVLSLVASSTHVAVRLGIVWVLSKRPVEQEPEARMEEWMQTRETRAKLLMTLLAGIFAVLQLCTVVVGYTRKGSFVWLPLLSAVFATFVLLIPTLAGALSTSTNTTRSATFLSLFLPIWPFVVAGKLYMIAWNVVQDFTDSMADIGLFLPMLLHLNSCVLACYERRRERRPTDIQVPKWVFVLGSALSGSLCMLRMGGGFLVGYFLFFVTWWFW